MLRGKVLVAQGGGPTAVINQSLVGVVQEARKYAQVEGIYGALHGVSGIVKEELVDLTQETTANLERVAATPSSALGSTRDKPDAAYCEKIYKVLKAHNVRYFFYIGGNDSSDTCRLVGNFAKAENYEMAAVHVPKTVDNDLMENDHVPGFPSAARFVGCAFSGINLDNKALPGVYVGVVMGRHAGFLTAAAALGRIQPDDGPHLIYLPERTFDMDRFLADVKRVYDQHKRCVIAASEGIHDAEGIPIVTRLMKNVEKDAHGNVQLSGTGALADLMCDQVKSKLGIKRVRGDTFGYLQRSFLGVVSDVDQREARESAQMAVKLGMQGFTGSVAIKRVGDYAVEYVATPIEKIAALTRVMPDEFINAEGNNVTPAFMNYIRPLVGTTLPDVSVLRAPKVAKILNK
ncbi:MAG: 6-phosphofructokinase [Magnetococcales bacterium]|nr:6-phosphofructokinase [Magnetococcales bacterium]